MTPSGTLREVVTLVRPTEVDAGGGVVTLTDATIASLRARVRAITGRELIRAGSLQGVATHEMTLRLPLPSSLVLKQGDTVTHRGVAHEVKAIVPDERQRTVTVLTRTREVGA